MEVSGRQDQVLVDRLKPCLLPSPRGDSVSFSLVSLLSLFCLYLANRVSLFDFSLFFLLSVMSVYLSPCLSFVYLFSFVFIFFLLSLFSLVPLSFLTL